MDKSTIIKKYSNGEVTIVWKPGQCIHSAICWKHPDGLIKVFNPSERPWIKPEGASTQEIINQVKKCPSGALSYTLNNETNLEPIKNKVIEPKTKVEIVTNGPYLLNGIFEIIDANGEIKEADQSCALCRCGGSKNKPFCDGSHTRNGFSD